jgi:Domain of unknown function (DUF4314)
MKELESNKMSELFDKTMMGKRVRLIHTDDPYTKLKKGDLGTIQFSFFNLDELIVQVKWDNGSNLGLIVGKDEYEVIRE